MPDIVDPGLAHEAAWALRRQPGAFAAAIDELPDAPETTFLRARLALVQGRMDEMLRIGDEVASRLDSRSVWRARLLETRGIVLGMTGMEDDAREHFVAAQTIYRGLGDAGGTASAMQNVAALRYQPTETVEQLLGEALEVARTADAPDLVGLILLNTASAEMELGRPVAQIEAHLRESSECLAGTWPELGHKALSTWVRLVLERGETTRAEELARGLPPITELRDPSTQASVALVLAELHLRRGHPDVAAAAVEALGFAELVPTDVPGVQMTLSRVREAQGRLPEALAAARQAHEAESALRDADSASAGRALDALHRTSQLRDDKQQEQRRAAALAKALAELQEATARIHEMSVRDTLTGMHNRLYLMDRGAELLRCATAEAPAEVALIDLDRFKEVNDTLGHAAGDRVLTAFAAALRGHLPDSDLVARYGGEEFVVIRPSSCSRQVSLATDLRRLRQVLRTAVVEGEDATLPLVTVSVGVSEAFGDRLDAALGEADALMYAAKRAGGDRVHGPTRPSLGPCAGVRDAVGQVQN